jgi:hypothetical protein
MQRKIWFLVLSTLLAVLVSSVAGAQGPESARPATTSLPLAPGGRGQSSSIAPSTAITATTWITVTSSADDYHDGNSKKCSDVPADECTLRRAINQAYAVAPGDRPVAIVFDIPTTDPGYSPTLGLWKITLTGTTANALRDLYGQTILDGSTQPGGRTEGPKIVVDGADSKNYGLILRNDDNVVRGLAMQHFNEAHISVSSDENAIEDCWFGLSDDGTTLSSGSDSDPEGGSGVAFAAGCDGNTVRDNVLAGFFQVAVAVRGSGNIVSGNRIGTRADGTVPLPPGFDQHPCYGDAWTGGVAMTVADHDNQIGGPTAAEGNLFAGLYLQTTDQSPVMDVSGQGHIIQNNTIGLDVNGDVVGVCGRGLDFGNGPQAMQVLDNIIVETRLSAIFMNASSLNGNTLQGNIIRRATDWPPAQGMNPFPEDAIAYGPFVPSALRSFVPAQVTSIDGTLVSGTSGVGSPCAHCLVELFLDDKDGITETLQSLALVTADEDGEWSASLPAPLAWNQGLRTMSTVPDSFTIIGLDAGTTSNLSVLYARYDVFLPLVSK